MEADGSATAPDPRALVVVSAVNLVEGGTLTVLRDCLAAGVAQLGPRVRFLALVHKHELVGVEGVEYREYPSVKESWLRRLNLEYRGFRALSARLRPALWLSLHDITPRLAPGIAQAVYCHNPAPFFRPRLSDLINEPKLLVFRAFYGFVYRTNHRRNALTIVQQEWLRRIFLARYQANKVLVAHPSALGFAGNPSATGQRAAGDGLRFVYPTVSRAFKNVETACEGFRRAQEMGLHGTLTVTIDAAENRYARKIVARYGDTAGIRFVGRRTREEMARLYADSDVLLFPSRLETWGLPITEAKACGLTVFAADLPYAHETVGTYADAMFLNPGDPDAWAQAMVARSAVDWRGHRAVAATPDEPYTRGWGEFWGAIEAEFLGRRPG